MCTSSPSSRAANEATSTEAPADPLAAARATIRARYGRSEPDIVAELLAELPLDEGEREAVTREAIWPQPRSSKRCSMPQSSLSRRSPNL